ncbi:hypothetical protein [Xanthomonas arboricola]|nr:hypothetical protein [Xanthomonas arboricola]
MAIICLPSPRLLQPMLSNAEMAFPLGQIRHGRFQCLVDIIVRVASFA